MKKLVLGIIVGLAIGIPVLVRAADTRLSSTSPYAQCFTATVVSGATCYTSDVASLTGTSLVTVTGGTVAVSSLAGGTVAVSNLAGGTVAISSLSGGTVAVSSLAGGTVAISNIASGTVAVSNITGGTIAVSSLAGGTVAVSNLAGGTVAVSSLGGGTVAVSNLAGGTVAVSSLAGGTVAISNIAAGTVAISSLAGGTVAVSNLAGGTVAVSSLAGGTVAVSSIAAITGTTFANVIPNAIVTQGVGVKTVSTSGTSLRLSSQAARAVVIKAICANTNNVYIVPGGTTSTDYSSTTNPGGLQLDNCESVTLPLISNVQEITIDADTNGEGVSYTWIGY